MKNLVNTNSKSIETQKLLKYLFFLFLHMMTSISKENIVSQTMKEIAKKCIYYLFGQVRI
jgi:hypothetical protein